MKNLRKNKINYEDPITHENIFYMWKIIRKTCKNKKAVFHFSLNVSTNINYIYYVLKNKCYTPSKYRAFMIFEPKPRLVMSQTITDKIINHFVANFYLIPLLEKSLIDTNVATRKGKGSSYAMQELKSYFNKLLIQNSEKEIYCLKIDISKYFYTIDHEILLKTLKTYIKDKNIIHLIEIIIQETNQPYINETIKKYREKYKISVPFYYQGKGLSIGAMSSQFLAIFYLNRLDHYIKENLKCKYYIRYMDDFLILDNDKERLKAIWKAITIKLEELCLKTNEKSNIYRSSKGFSFLGYKYQVRNRKLKISYYKKTYFKIKRKLSYLEKNSPLQYRKSLASYYGYFINEKKKEREDFKMKLIEKSKLYKKQYPDHILIMKEGIFYKTFYEDALIMWYLFEYKYLKDTVSFGTTPYDRVLAKLNKLDISYVVIADDKEVLKVTKDKENYESYLKISQKSYEKEAHTKELVNKLKEVLEIKPDSYEKINIMLNHILIEDKTI